MTHGALIPPRGLFPCHDCGAPVRAVERTTGGIIVIDESPDPHGNIIPWPSKDLVGVAQARIMTPPIATDLRWSEHSCR